MLTDNYSCLQWWYFYCRWYLFKYRVILHYVSKGIWDCFRFALLHSVIGLENSHHSLKKSNSNLKAVVPWPPKFSHASSSLFVFTSSSDWLLIGCCNTFGFGLTTLNWRAFYTSLSAHTDDIFTYYILMKYSLVRNEKNITHRSPRQFKSITLFVQN